MVRRLSTILAVYMVNLGEMKALTTVEGNDVMHGSQLVSLHVLCTGEIVELQRTHLEGSEWNLTPWSQHVQSMNERMHEERSREGRS